MMPNTPLDPRLTQLTAWLHAQLNPQAGTDKFTIVPASSDASFRRYFRVQHAGRTMIAMDAPPAQEDTAPFIRIAAHLFAQGVPVPEIFAQDTAAGFLLIEDLGAQAYLDVLNADTAPALYGTAMDALITLQSADHTGFDLPAYDAALLQQEMQLFPDWFLTKHLQLAVPDFLGGVFDLLVDNALAQPTVFVHRDYHSRNLMQRTDGKLGVIDFQDAVMGPISYDLASLLRDSYIAWPADKITEWVTKYWQKATAAGLTDCTLPQFVRWFDLMGLQRQLKILGIFCRLHYRDGKANYLNDLPQTLAYVLQVTAQYDDTALVALHQFMVDNNVAARL